MVKIDQDFLKCKQHNTKVGVVVVVEEDIRIKWGG